MWSHAKPTDTLWDICAPEDAKPSQFNVEKAYRSYTEGTHERTGRSIFFQRTLGDKIPLSQVTSSQLNKSLAKLSAASQAFAKAELAKVIYFLATGKAREKRLPAVSALDETKSGFTFDVSSHKVADLARLMPCNPGRGRFAELRLSIARMIRETPPGEFRSVDPGSVKTDAREIRMIGKQLSQFINKTYTDWTCIWNPVDGVFAIARKKDIDITWKGGSK